MVCFSTLFPVLLHGFQGLGGEEQKRFLCFWTVVAACGCTLLVSVVESFPSEPSEVFPEEQQEGGVRGRGVLRWSDGVWVWTG